MSEKMQDWKCQNGLKTNQTKQNSNNDNQQQQRKKNQRKPKTNWCFPATEVK